MALPTNFADQKIDTSQNVNRKYTAIKNNDDTYSFTDVTIYEDEGSVFYATNMNETNTQVNANTNKIGTSTLTTLSQNLCGAVNELKNDIEDAELGISTLNDDLNGFQFKTEDGVNYVKGTGADTWTPFKSGADVMELKVIPSTTGVPLINTSDISGDIYISVTRDDTNASGRLESQAKIVDGVLTQISVRVSSSGASKFDCLYIENIDGNNVLFFKSYSSGYNYTHSIVIIS